MRNFWFLLKYIPLFRFFKAKRKYGYSLLTLLYIAKTNQNTISIDDYSISNSELFEKALNRAYHLYLEGLKPQDKVILIGNNSWEWLLQLMALSGLGVHIYLINPKMKAVFIRAQIQKIGTDKIWIDPESQALLHIENAIIIAAETKEEQLSDSFLQQLKKSKSSIYNLSSGSSGQVKKEERQIRLLPFIRPFLSIMNSIRPYEDETILIGISCAHGYGMAALLQALALKRNIVLTANDTQTIEAINKHKIDCWVSLPSQIETILERIPDFQNRINKIITGSEPIKPQLIQQLINSGIQVFNLYGTTETGVLCLADTKMLKEKNNTIGRPLKGVSFMIQKNKNGLDELWVKTAWSSSKRKDQYTATGDRIAIDEEGYWYHLGRTDGQMLSKGHLVSKEMIEELVLKAFPDLDIQIHFENGIIQLKILNSTTLETREDIKQQILQILPTHLRPQQIIWD